MWTFGEQMLTFRLLVFNLKNSAEILIYTYIYIYMYIYMYILMFSPVIYIYICVCVCVCVCVYIWPMLISPNSQWMTTLHKYPFGTQTC